jgi:hypothetical protein
VVETSTAVRNQIVGIHGLIVQDNWQKVKGLWGPLEKILVRYATDAAIVGVPQLLVR